jgi:glycerophosphoryl diester phosphodiesterase
VPRGGGWIAYLSSCPLLLRFSESAGEIHILKKIIIAHRGAPFFARENTLESFKQAISLGADMIEFDVRRTKDKVFCHHDRSIQGRLVKSLTYEEISQIARV